ncbi:MAG: [Fe-Fe] hydrogenase large subunit C-terminal domain-containing protein [Eubacterium sp.]
MGEFLRLKKSNCKNCYKCIRNCPVKSIRFSGNQANIVSDECILCGNCVIVCPQNAKEITDETEKVKVLLSENSHVIVSMAPSFAVNYKGAGINSMKAALKKLGFFDVEETAIGATIVKKEYERMASANEKDIIISSCCNTVNLLIQKYYQYAIKYLADVVTPLQAHCVDIKKRYPDAKIVFVGPCLSKKDEVDRYKGYADCAMTFEELTRWLEEENITIEPQADSAEESKARLFPIEGGILDTMEKNSEYTYMSVSGIDNCIAALQNIEKGNVHKCFIEMSACAGGCVDGPGMDEEKGEFLNRYLGIVNYAGKKDFPVNQPDSKDVKRTLLYIDKHQNIPGESEIEKILVQMGKTSKELELNCGTCGYNTCREKAIAIYQGKADVSMCLPFLKDKAESFSDSILNNTPNGIIVLNEEMEIQQINKAAMRILNIRDSNLVIGEQVIRILDPKKFMDVKNTGTSIRNERVYLADYNRYVEQTIDYNRNFRNIICIMRDVTDEEIQRKKKEEIARRTIEIADKVVDKQMRTVQEIASLLGETTAETKIVLTKLKEATKDE